MAYAAVTILMDTLRQNFLQPKPIFALRRKTKVRSLYRNLCALQTSLLEDSKAVKGLEARIRDVSVEMRFQIEQLLVRLFHLGKAMKARRKSAQKLLPVLNRPIEYIKPEDLGLLSIKLEELILRLMRKYSVSPVSRVPSHIKKILNSLCIELQLCCSRTLVKLELHFNLPGMPVHIKKRVKSLCKKLRFHSSKHSPNISTQRLIIEAKSLIIQELRACHLKKYSKQRKEARQRLRLMFRLGNKFTAYIKKELLKGSESSQQLHNATSLGDLEHNKCLTTVGDSSQHTSKSAIKMVGCIDELNTIMRKLNRQSLEREIVSILGMGGIGKTTLAKRVYQDASIISHFDCRAWVTVSQEYDSRQVLQCLLNSVSSEKIEINEDANMSMSNHQLAENVYRCLKLRRYLIVIDDIWSKDVWNNLRNCLPEDHNGSRILLTTRIKDVAEHATPGSNFCHNMRFLDSQESWNLFHNKVSEKIFFSPEFETIGRGIVEKCKGLPLAIIVAAGLLSKSKQTLNEWEHIAKNLSTLLNQDDSDQQCVSILSLSYTFLPLHLKPCFLSFGLFPEDSEIPIEEIVYFWVSEGFLSVMRSKSLEDVARESIQDLIDRNLVQVCSLNASGKTKKCQIHDVLRDLALIEAKRENLLYTHKQHKDKVMLLKYKRTQPVSFSLKAQRLVVQSRISSSHHLSPFDSFSSILWLQKNSTSLRLLSSLVFVNLQLLRGLVISKILVKDTNILCQVMGLVHLRYLSFEMYHFDISYLPWFMLWNLQILKVNGVIECGETPGIWELPHVRHLYLKSIYSQLPPRSVQDSLESVYWLDYRSCTKELFMMTPNLMKLGIHDYKGIPECREDNNWFESLAYLYKLQELDILGNIIHSTGMCLENYLPNLKKLKLVKMKLKWKDIDVIGTLPNLEVLKLCDAVYGPKWETISGRFLQLKYLLISGSDLQDWEASADHFPMLERLALNWCYKLEKIPCDFADIATLQLIELFPCSNTIIACAEHIREVQQDSGNDAFVLHYYDPIRDSGYLQGTPNRQISTPSHHFVELQPAAKRQKI
ncbi:PREDICTED: putative disease resistance RPP13-like protein 3 [Ipomoea nil]|uniref:putative disease resistance RPP13-like protein 3 n=1 Tax=Ipomoea nil TaxID=35883 RepID=UPI000901316C|nr:PREDICTED: putative disease resistance RPP13-like protein 3 [Ipomoea nil]